MQDEHTHSPVNEEESLEHLRQLHEHFSRQYVVSGSRKDRCTELMERKRAKTWSPEKSSRMVRRLVTATKDFEDADSALSRIAERFSQNGYEVPSDAHRSNTNVG